MTATAFSLAPDRILVEDGWRATSDNARERLPSAQLLKVTASEKLSLGNFQVGAPIAPSSEAWKGSPALIAGCASSRQGNSALIPIRGAFIG
jgi:hypothetical protein